MSFLENIRKLAETDDERVTLASNISIDLYNAFVDSIRKNYALSKERDLDKFAKIPFSAIVSFVSAIIHENSNLSASDHILAREQFIGLLREAFTMADQFLKEKAEFEKKESKDE